MPINNTIKLPYYLKTLVDKHLLDIDVPPNAVSKKEPLKPADVTLKFNTKDTALKIALVRFIQFIPIPPGSPHYQLNADDLQQQDSMQLRITGFQHLRRLTPDGDNEGLRTQRQKMLAGFQTDYINLARGQLKKRLDENKDILAQIREFDREDFTQSYTNAQTFEDVSACHVELERMLEKGVIVVSAQPQPLSPHSASIEPSTKLEDTLRRGSLSYAPSVRRMLSAPPSLNTKAEAAPSESPEHKGNSEDEEDGSPSLLIEVENQSDARPEAKTEASRSSPSHSSVSASAGIQRYVKVFSSKPEPKIEENAEEEAKVVINRGEFNDELKEFLRETIRDPLPKGAKLPEDPATHCSTGHELCQIPVIVNHKRYDFMNLTKIPGFAEAPYFMDPGASNKRIYKFDIHADPESRKTALIRLAKQSFYAEFINNHNAAYADAGFFKRSNFRNQRKNIKDFDDLVMFIVANPSSRSAKIFVGMTTLQIDDPLVNFLRNTFLPDYQSAWFKRSTFLEKIANKDIKTYEDAEGYANFNPDTRTARLMRK